MSVDDPSRDPVAAPPQSQTQPSWRELRRVALSSYLGNTIEFYDFILFASASALIFGPLFFTSLSPTVGVLAAFATFATGYIARPLGAFVFGHIGDRAGRKSTLIWTMTIMGLASGFIGLLPTYAQVGTLAPVLLVILRMLQGFAVGGEWGGAALMTAEYAPPGRRGFLTSFSQAGLPSGGLLSTLAMAGVGLLPQEQLMSWGWRLPFIASFLLLGVGLYMRLRISESPLFTQMERIERERRVPVVGLFRDQKASLLRGIAASLPVVMASTLFGSFAISYAVQQGHSRSSTLSALAVSWVLAIALTPLFGLLSDRFGRRQTYLVGAVLMAVLTLPVFLLIGAGSTALLYIGVSLLSGIGATLMNASLAAQLSEMFATSNRYTGVSLAYQGGTLVAGFTPLIVGALAAAANGSLVWVAVFVVVVCLVAAGAVWATSDRRHETLGVVRAGPA
ncbi:MFS transporter [Pseudonocardia sp. WMMC193]|uniref:MFS transporter n=1 Tax=Pseudonocardia sp. WMMC193 TaxID=2911965 RepID=UPI001F1D2D06|nr:MFS transporter [Pseudonocardia sp. WMMC193]MCF7549337.1 MHS family MFS transporter [Pseudonocardia sp. WMMC193]